jgi:hypothetical protein
MCINPSFFREKLGVGESFPIARYYVWSGDCVQVVLGCYVLVFDEDIFLVAWYVGISELVSSYPSLGIDPCVVVIYTSWEQGESGDSSSGIHCAPTLHIGLAWTSSAVLKRSDDREHLCLVFHLTGQASSFLTVSMMLAVSFG